MLFNTRPTGSTKIMFQSIVPGDGFYFYGQLYIKTADNAAYCVSKQRMNTWTREGGGRFHTWSLVVPLGKVAGFNV